ncbi:nuclease NucT [Mycobacteroides abscessus subsp. massiliense]|uniref:DISARM system phospholipase D-like protein DrmC n=1 Tax=Mycobacteroides abscessus TaxID=36809 RepID=UPI0009A608A2|nr:DISARM system phospholipase D-like protein DrmC [Mycobacteroides abscessus]RIU06884.1 cardiolipin synthase [Mycobacteroides abscessus]SLD27277.1 nuclease NucT [Mycobacteroides abscessus subsp. massiliense]SLI18321.1 nuclease NucT [Mycobacteroides abscessus subsp. massiliense]
MSDDALKQLGEYLTATEAESLAVLIEAGEHTTHALASVSHARRDRAANLMKTAGIGHTEPALSVAVLRGIAGAKSAHRDLTPVWTMPGNEATTGHLTNQFHDVVAAARISVTCATYNFSSTSSMWDALQTASEEPEVVVCVYVDAGKGDPGGVKARLPRANVYRSANLPNGQSIVSHTKFIVVDHEIVLLTSANFSYNAENRNIEFGLLIRDSGLAASIESTMGNKRGSLYELV